MMARSSNAPSIGRIQKRKTNFSKSIIFGLQRAAGPYRRAMSRHPLYRPATRQACRSKLMISPLVRLLALSRELESYN